MSWMKLKFINNYKNLKKYFFLINIDSIDVFLIVIIFKYTFHIEYSLLSSTYKFDLRNHLNFLAVS